jgi:type IV pilus assembly protein PilM
MLRFGRRTSKRDELVAIDLGSRVTKAVLLQRRGTEIFLLNYALLELEEGERAPSREVLAEHLRKVVRLLGTTARRTTLNLGSAKTLLTHLDLPAASPADLRRMIRLSPKNYLQRDITDHVFDCHVSGPREEIGTDHVPRIRRKAKVLVGGAREADVVELTSAARDAGLQVDRVTLSQVAIANAFQARPEDKGEVVALLDIGYATTTINIMMAGELVFTRVITFGAERFSDVLTQSPKLRSAEMGDSDGPAPDEMQTRLQRAILLLAREVDASIGFFVSQHESTVSRILVSGGSARSQFILQTLEAELGLPCESWGPTAGVKIELAEPRRQEFEYEAPQLLVAAGAGLGAFASGLISINLLAEEQETQEWRRQDPVRRGFWGAGAAVGLILLWGAWEAYQGWRAGQQLVQLQARLKTLQETPGESVISAQRIQEMEKRILALGRQGQERTLWAPMLGALEFTTVEDIEFHKLSVNLTVTKPPPPPAAPAPGSPAAARTATAPAPKPKPAPPVTEKILLSIQGKNYGDPKQIGRLIEEIARHPYFKDRLRADQPVLLKDLQPRQVDPNNPNRSFALFVIECYGAEKALKNE